MEELMAKYLAGELSKKERTDFESQLIQNEQFSLEFEAYINAWSLHEPSQGSSFDTVSAWAKVNDQILTESVPVMQVVDKKSTGTNGETGKSNKAEISEFNAPATAGSKFSFMKIAATLLILALGGYVAVTNLNSDTLVNDTTEHLSAQTSTDEFELPDGTLVKLNANSKLTYDKNFGIEHRNVTLMGEANFDVKRNENLPFIIEAGQSQVEVLGTSFDIAAYPGKEVKLVVTEGTVSFASRKKADVKEILTKGQQAVIDVAGEVIQVSEVTNDNFKSWWTREFQFENALVSEIFETLEKTYHVEIDYPEAMKNCKWTHSNSKDFSIEQVFDLFKASFTSVSFDIKENQIKLEGTACDN